MIKMNGSFFRDTIELMERQGLRRQLQPVLPLPGGKLSIAGKIYLNLSSNDYLGLSQHRALKEAAAAAIEKWGIGSGASRLITGNHQLYECLEEKVARFKNKEASLIFSSGYMANIGVLSSLLQKGDRVFSDELNHASIIDGIRMSKARVYIYRHGDTEHLEELISASSEEGRPVIVTDTVFSMDGDIAPLDRLAAIRRRHDCLLVVDEAHATGVLGKNGAGAAEFFQVEKDIDVTVGTFSKALGSYGAYVAGSRELIDFLTNRARSLIYTTALPAAVLAANIASLEVMTEDPGLRERLKSNAAFLSQGLSGMGFRILPSQTAILPLMVGESRQAIDFSSELLQEGIVAKPIRPPTVPEGTARIRLTASAAHSAYELEQAMAAFQRCGKKTRLIQG